jgi:hypothetical protein
MCKTCSVADGPKFSAFLTPDPVWEKIRTPDPRSRINISDHISDRAVIIFGLKILKILRQFIRNGKIQILDGKTPIRDPG